MFIWILSGQYNSTKEELEIIHNKANELTELEQQTFKKLLNELHNDLIKKEI
jgi:ClpP class serine protease